MISNTWLAIDLDPKEASPLLAMPPNIHAPPNKGYKKLWLLTYANRESPFLNPFSWNMIENLGQGGWCILNRYIYLYVRDFIHFYYKFRKKPKYL